MTILDFIAYGFFATAIPTLCWMIYDGIKYIKNHNFGPWDLY